MGEITGYSVRYGVSGTIEKQTIRVSGDTSAGTTIISGLQKETVYEIDVAAETIAGTGVYSNSATVTTPDGKLLGH